MILVPSGNILGTSLPIMVIPPEYILRENLPRPVLSPCHHVVSSRGSTSSLGRLINTTKGHCLREGGSIKPFNSLINLQNVV